MRRFPVYASGFLVPLGLVGNSSDIRQPGGTSATMVVAASGDPLVVRDESGRIRGSVDRALAGEVGLAVGIGWNTELIGSIAGQSQTTADQMASPVALPEVERFDDARVGARVAPFGGPLTVRATVAPNTGNADLDLAAQTRLGRRLVLGVLTGFRAREREVVYDTTFDDALAWAGGAQLGLIKGAAAVAEVHGEVGMHGAGNPSEWMTGLRLDHGPVGVYLMGGAGLGEEAGAPAWRMTMAATYRPANKERRSPMIADLRLIPDAPPADLELARLAESDGDVIVDSATPNVSMRNREIMLGEPVFFELDQKRIKHAFYPILDELALFLTRHPEVPLVLVQGHTCDVGDDAYNDWLSQVRSEAVVDYLARRGVQRRRLVTQAYGEHKPLVPNTDSAARSQNRRVIFTVISPEARP